MKKIKTRRDFVENSIKAGLLLPFIGSHLLSCSSKESKETAENNNSKGLRILILGGTSFLGPHQIAYAISRGHTISTFTRGKTKPTIYTDLFENVEQLVGDRADNLTALENKKWDVVIDNSGRKAEWTKASAALLKDAADVYLYTSSTGVYYPYLGSGMDEQSQVLLKMPEDIKDEGMEMEYDFGIMKANSEVETIEAFGEDRSIIVRPTYMFGPADKTYRFIYWPLKLSKGGEVIVPGKSNDPVQYIDVRDVAEWMIRLAEEKKAGTYNAVGPQSPQTIHEFVKSAKQAFDTESTFIKIDDYQFLKENDLFYLVPWILPEGDHYGTARINNEKAIKAGLTFRDVKETIKDIYDWWHSDAVTEKRRKSFESKPESIMVREKSIIENWKNKMI